MPPDYTPLRRSFSILRALQRAPATRDEITSVVRGELGREAYPDDQRTAIKQFEHDLARLRDLGLEIAIGAGHVYQLQSYGEFSPVELGEEDLDTVAFLQESFSAGAPNGEAVQRLLHLLLDWIPERQRSAVLTRRQRLRMDLRRRDDDNVPPAVQEAVDRAIIERRRLQFLYRSPGQADGAPRLHVVEPWGQDYDTIRHHYYLDAFCVCVTGPRGDWNRQQWQRYRLGRILAEEIRVLPEKLPPTPPKRPSHPLEYLLAPEIARLGQVSRHFDDMEVHPPDEDGWVRVTAKTDDLFGAVRLLLGYGPACVVVGGAEARRGMEKLVKKTYERYVKAG